jgi:hypothetical protein
MWLVAVEDVQAKSAKAAKNAKATRHESNATLPLNMTGGMGIGSERG